jgi:hypothetical protein
MVLRINFPDALLGAAWAGSIERKLNERRGTQETGFPDNSPLQAGAV